MHAASGAAATECASEAVLELHSSLILLLLSWSLQKSMDVCYEVLNKRIEQADHAQKHTLTRLVKPLWDQLDNSITAAKNVERELQRKQQQRRAQPVQRTAA